MSAPNQVLKMLAVEGVYLISDPESKTYSVVHVDADGVVQQMKFDGVLRLDGWNPDVVIRGPLTANAKPLTDEPLGWVPPKQQLVSGGPVTADHREINPATGMQKDYVVLSADERAKGYVRPVRRSYVHNGKDAKYDGAILVKLGTGGCGALTTMASAIAETYARDPKFYSGTYCTGCRTHRPLYEFVWDGTTEIVGS